MKIICNLFGCTKEEKENLYECLKTSYKKNAIKEFF